MTDSSSHGRQEQVQHWKQSLRQPLQKPAEQLSGDVKLEQVTGQVTVSLSIQLNKTNTGTDKVEYAYNAKKPGTYHVVATYRSGDTNNGNKLAWSEANNKITGRKYNNSTYKSK